MEDEFVMMVESSPVISKGNEKRRVCFNAIVTPFSLRATNIFIHRSDAHDCCGLGVLHADWPTRTSCEAQHLKMLRMILRRANFSPKTGIPMTGHLPCSPGIASRRMHYMCWTCIRNQQRPLFRCVQSRLHAQILIAQPMVDLACVTTL
jgi:hypothetical protein